MHQVATVQHRHDLHAVRKNVIVELLDFVVDAIERRVGFRSLAQQDNAHDYVVVVDDLPVRAMNCLPDAAQPDLWPLLDGADIVNPNWSPILRLEDGQPNIVHVLEETDGTYVHFLQPRLDEASACIH